MAGNESLKLLIFDNELVRFENVEGKRTCSWIDQRESEIVSR